MILLTTAGKYYVTKRDTTEQLIRNALFTLTGDYIGKYARTNVGSYY